MAEMEIKSNYGKYYDQIKVDKAFLVGTNTME